MNDFEEISSYLSFLKKLLQGKDYWYNRLLIFIDDCEILKSIISNNLFNDFKHIDIVVGNNYKNIAGLEFKNVKFYRLKKITNFSGEEIEKLEDHIDEKMIACDDDKTILLPASYKYNIISMCGNVTLFAGIETKDIRDRFYFNQRPITGLGKKNHILCRKVGK